MPGAASVGNADRTRYNFLPLAKRAAAWPSTLLFAARHPRFDARVCSDSTTGTTQVDLVDESIPYVARLPRVAMRKRRMHLWVSYAQTSLLEILIGNHQ